jgi:hypothetical protein
LNGQLPQEGNTIAVRSVLAVVDHTRRKDRPPFVPLQAGLWRTLKRLRAERLIAHDMRQPVYSLLRGTPKNFSSLLPEGAVIVE